MIRAPTVPCLLLVVTVVGTPTALAQTVDVWVDVGGGLGLRTSNSHQSGETGFQWRLSGGVTLQERLSVGVMLIKWSQGIGDQALSKAGIFTASVRIVGGLDARVGYGGGDALLGDPSNPSVRGDGPAWLVGATWRIPISKSLFVVAGADWIRLSFGDLAFGPGGH